MKVQFLRRRKLGNGSCKGIVGYLQELGVQDAEVIRNDRQVADAPIVVRWGCTSSTQGGGIIINPSEGIHRVCEKDTFRRLLQDSGVSVPKSFFSKEDAKTYALSIENMCISPWYNFPKMIGRKRHHSQGRHAEVIEYYDDLDDSQSDYWSVILPKQKEFRVYCFFGKVIAVAEKVVTDPTVLLWNRAQGNSTFENVRWGNWPLQVVAEALKVHKLSGCDFEGVDVMLYNDVPYILESNSAPSLTTEYRKMCFAKGFKWVIDICRRGPDYVDREPSEWSCGGKPRHLTVSSEARENYKKYIHPAITE